MQQADDAETLSSQGDHLVPFVFRVGAARGQELGLCVGTLHIPYGCNGGGVEGEYSRGNGLRVCEPRRAMTLVYSKTSPHQLKLLDKDNRSRCLNVDWWKFEENVGIHLYDAYPAGPATGQKWVLNENGSISPQRKPELVLGLTSCEHGTWLPGIGSEGCLKLVPRDSSQAIFLSMANHSRWCQEIPADLGDGAAFTAGAEIEEDPFVPFVFRVGAARRQVLGLCVGTLYDPVHAPYRCKYGLEGEYCHCNYGFRVCEPRRAMTLVYSKTSPHQLKLLDKDNRSRCLNVDWWKFEENVGIHLYDAYPAGPATGQKWVLNENGSISPQRKPELVLGLTSCEHGTWLPGIGSEGCLKLVPRDSSQAIFLSVAAMPLVWDPIWLRRKSCSCVIS